MREINKAYAGFKGTPEIGEKEENRKPIITGKWLIYYSFIIFEKY